MQATVPWLLHSPLITVTDNEVPVINGTPANITQSNDPGQCGAAVTWTPATVSDNCPGSTISSDHQPGDVFPLGTTTVTYTATDAAGNPAVATSFTITVTDNEVPVINGTPANITQSNDPVPCGGAATGRLQRFLITARVQPSAHRLLAR